MLLSPYRNLPELTQRLYRGHIEVTEGSDRGDTDVRGHLEVMKKLKRSSMCLEYDSNQT